MKTPPLTKPFARGLLSRDVRITETQNSAGWQRLVRDIRAHEAEARRLMRPTQREVQS